jgi:hypothetical protein
MPRPGPRRVWMGARLFTPDEHEAIQRLANEQTGGNLSEMIRVLVMEALGARERCDRHA